jgi:hypothetical protein
MPGITTSEITMSKAASPKKGERARRVRNAHCLEAPRLEQAGELRRLGPTVFDDKNAGHVVFRRGTFLRSNPGAMITRSARSPVFPN